MSLKDMMGVRLVGGAVVTAVVTFAAAAAAALAAEPSKEATRVETPATFQGPTEPAKAPKNIKVAIIPCAAAFHGCTSPADAAAEAAKALGWTVTQYDGGGDQQKQNAAMLDAVSAGSNLILLMAIDPNFVQLGLAAAKKAGIPVLSGTDSTHSPNPIIKPTGDNLNYVLDVSPSLVEVGRRMAEWTIADSGGKANVLVIAADEFPSVRAENQGQLAGLKECAGCVVQPLMNTTGSQVATTLGQQVVGYLQSHPDVNYVLGPFDPADVFVVNAIAQAGLGDRVKLVGELGDEQNLDFIRNKRVQVADCAIDNTYIGYAVIDQAIRVLNGQPVIEPNGENVPFQMLDETNLPPAGADWHASYDYKSAYLKLWQ
jgi:ABC-type sugar transport system substrate-binding protein